MEFHMAKAKRFSQTKTPIKEISNKGSNKGREFLHGVTERSMKESSKKAKCMERENLRKGSSLFRVNSWKTKKQARGN